MLWGGLQNLGARLESYALSEMGLCLIVLLGVCSAFEELGWHPAKPSALISDSKLR